MELKSLLDILASNVPQKELLFGMNDTGLSILILSFSKKFSAKISNRISFMNFRVIIPPGTENGEIITVPIIDKLKRFMVEDIDTFYVKVLVQKSTYFFKKDGLDVYSRVDIDPNTAMNGGSVKVVGLHTPYLSLDVPAGISSHTILSLRGEGIKIAGLDGDHHVEIGINLEELSKKDESYLKELNTNDDTTPSDSEEIITPIVVNREFQTQI